MGATGIGSGGEGVTGSTHSSSNAGGYSIAGAGPPTPDVSAGRAYLIDFEGRAVGAQLAFATPVIDFTFDYEARHVLDLYLREIALGLRKRFTDDPDQQPYVYVQWKRDLEDQLGSPRFNGWGAGLGFLFDAFAPWFVDLKLGWEDTHNLDNPNGRSRTSELVLKLGVGISF